MAGLPAGWIPDEEYMGMGGGSNLQIDDPPSRGRGRGRRRARPADDDVDVEDWGGPEPQRRRLDPEYDDPEPEDQRIINEEKNENVDARAGGAPAFVYYWRWTYSVLHGQSKPEFRGSFERLSREMKAFGGSRARFIFQLEDPRGDESNLHFQGFINLAEKKRIGQLIGHFNRPAMFPGMQIGYASNAGKEQLKAYCMKSDSRVAGPWGDRPIAPTYEGKDIPAQWWPWQKEVIDSIMTTEPDDRTINYVVDKAGKQGKSKVAKFLAWKGVARRFGWVEAKNAFYSISEGGARKAYIFDLTRTKPKKMTADDLYSILEDIKNGHVDGSLYANEEVLFAPPHVWVFANCAPKREAMSADRFRVWSITSDHRLVPFEA